MVRDPLSLLTPQAAIVKQTVEVEPGLTVHYRHDLPGLIEAPSGFSSHLLTFFLTNNPQQITRMGDHGEYDGEMKQGEFYLYPANYPGRTVWQSVDKTLHFIIGSTFLDKIASESGLTPSACSLEFLPVLRTQDPQIAHVAQLFLMEMTHAFEAQKLYLESLSTVFGIHLIRHYSNLKLAQRPMHSTAAGLSPSQLKRVLDYIHDQLESDLSLSQLAQQVGLSRSYFAKQFKQAMHITPHHYINQQRVDRAKQLLKNLAVPIADVAMSCGFSNQSHFTKVFRQQLGITPKAYRDQL